MMKLFKLICEELYSKGKKELDPNDLWDNPRNGGFYDGIEYALKYFLVDK